MVKRIVVTDKIRVQFSVDTQVQDARGITSLNWIKPRINIPTLWVQVPLFISHSLPAIFIIMKRWINRIICFIFGCEWFRSYEGPHSYKIGYFEFRCLRCGDQKEINFRPLLSFQYWKAIYKIFENQEKTNKAIERLENLIGVFGLEDGCKECVALAINEEMSRKEALNNVANLYYKSCFKHYPYPLNAVKPKLATDLPKPPPLTKEDMERIDKESTELVKAVGDHTKKMEEINGEDLRKIIK